MVCTLMVLNRKRVAVRRRARDDRGADIARRAGAIFDHDRLAERLLQMAADDARQDVGRAARRERHDERDVARGIGLGRLLKANAASGA